MKIIKKNFTAAKWCDCLWDKNTVLIQWYIYANDFYFKITVDYPKIKNYKVCQANLYGHDLH